MNPYVKKLMEMTREGVHTTLWTVPKFADAYDRLVMPEDCESGKVPPEYILNFRSWLASWKKLSVLND